MTRKKPAPTPTRDELRAADNVRPLGDLDPSQCAMQRERQMFDKGHNCWTCAYRWNDATTHCHLPETCDRCRDASNPCDTAAQLAQPVKSSTFLTNRWEGE